MVAPIKRGKRPFSRKKSYYDQNDGVTGVVYILINPGLAKNYLKIGCSRYSGKKRAESLNKDARTGTPGEFECWFEQKTVDCGLAEKYVFHRLKKYRKGKKGQEYFCMSFRYAKSVIKEECEKIDRDYAEKEKAKLQEKLRGSRLMLGRYAALKESI